MIAVPASKCYLVYKKGLELVLIADEEAQKPVPCALSL